MSKLARVVVSCSAVLLSIIGISSCGGGSDEIVARVGRAAITKPEFEHWLSVGAATGATRLYSPATQASARDPRSYATQKQQTLSFLISSTRTIGEAAEKGIDVSDTQAKAALDRLRYERIYGTTTPLPKEAELQSLLSGKGETPSDRLWIVKVHLLVAKLEQRQLVEAEQKITYAQLASYYAKNRRRFVVPERRDVEVIETFRKAKIETAKREIQSGQSLHGVVQRRNDEPDVGGSLRGLSRRALRHGYENNYFRAKPGVLVGPLKSEIYYLFEVTAVMPARQQTLEEVQAKIRRELISGAQRRVFANTVRALDERWRSKTFCATGYAVEQCAGSDG